MHFYLTHHSCASMRSFIDSIVLFWHYSVYVNINVKNVAIGVMANEHCVYYYPVINTTLTNDCLMNANYIQSSKFHAAQLLNINLNANIFRYKINI